MDNGMTYILFICIMVPLFLMLPLLTSRARLLVVYMMIGIFCCLFAASINGYIKEHLSQELYYITTNITPITEEIIKALPILYYAFVFDSKKSKILPLSFAVGVGFAVLENMIILTQNIETVSILWALVRGFASGLMHGVCTAIIGYGISFVRTRKKFFVCGTFALLMVSINYHAAFNILVQSDTYKYWGFVLPLSPHIPVVIFILYKRRKASEKTA